MKSLKKIILLNVLLFTFYSVLSQEWECEDCPKRKVGLFDLDVWLKNPANSPSQISYADWQELFMVAGGIHNSLFNNDPSKECLNYFDGQMAMISNLDEQNYQIGYTSTSLPPPAGTMDEVNYWVSGIIAQQESDGAVIIKVYVLASGTGDTVVEASIPYDFSLSGTQNGNNIGKKLIPVMGKIRAFEKKKRNNNNEIVIDPEGKGAELELTLKKEKIKVGEKAEAEIELIDCDGIPIKNMEVKLTAKGGKFDPEKVTTDESGVATTKFTANCDPGKYNQVFQFMHRYPYSFEKGTAGGDTDIEIEAGDKFDLIYNHSLKQSYGGQFLLQSSGNGTIPCTINWDSEPPSIQGTGTVNATWTGNADECKFVGTSSFTVQYKGTVIYNESGGAQIKLGKVSDSPIAGEFKIICGSYTQTVPESMPMPAVEEDRILIFSFKDGETQQLDVPETDTHYSYQIKLKCK